MTPGRLIDVTTFERLADCTNESPVSPLYTKANWDTEDSDDWANAIGIESG